jgi:hypothetical protein
MQKLTYTEYTKLSFKDIESLLTNVSTKTAKQYFTDIKRELNVKTVLFCHFKQYFKIEEVPKRPQKTPKDTLKS